MNAVKIGSIWYWCVWNTKTDGWSIIDEVSDEDIKKMKLEEKEETHVG